MSSRSIFRFGCLIFSLILLTGIYAYAVEPRMVLLEEVSVPLEGLPRELDGFTIGVMADLHVETTPLSTIHAAAKRLAGLEPDVTVIVGDLAEDISFLGVINDALEPLGSTYGVPGNWDRWSETPEYADLLSVEMLVNRGISITPGIWLCGIDDALLGYPSIDDAVAGAPEGSIKILLAHEPDVAEWVEPQHGISLQISGHSHGGQIRLPYIWPLLLPPLGQQYHSGLATASTHFVYTTRGVGMSHIPVRFLCPPEITLIKLVKP